MYLQQRGVPSTNVNVQVSIVATWIVRGTMGYLGVSLTSENEQRRSKNSMSRKRNRPGFISRKMNREGCLGISLANVIVQDSLVAKWIVRDTWRYRWLVKMSFGRSNKSMSRKRNRPGFLSRKMNREGYLEVSLTSENELREKQKINESQTWSSGAPQSQM